jgi:glycosyltransferase involved in cell wall biosynthesis
LAGILIRRRPRLVYLTLSQGNGGFLRDTVFVVLARLGGARVVGHLRGSKYVEFAESRGSFMRRVVRSTFRSCTRVVVLGESLRPMAEAVAPGIPVDVVPNGCADFAGDRATRQRPERPSVDVLFLSNLLPEKGWQLAVEAASRLAAAGRPIRLRLAGEWNSADDEARTRATVSEQGLTDAFEFLGVVSGDAKTAALLDSDVFTLPSYAEGHPWTVVEAMCAGLPVVATDTGAVAETVDDGVTGFVIPVGDVDTLAERLDRLVSDRELRRRMGLAGRDRYARLFTIERSHELLGDCWASALGATPGSGVDATGGPSCAES